MQLPRLTDHFTLGPELGRGGFGVVYRGTTRDGGEPVAIKILLQPPDEVAQGRMDREARALVKVRHPRLAAFHGLYLDPQGGVALVYQYVPGEPMEEVLRDRLPGRERGLRWCRDLADALDALHQAGVVHRDVKPGNLIIGPDDRLTLLDFGLVRDVEAGATVTQHGLVVGTPQFMAPELLKGERASPASDMYAFGCLVHLLAAGSLPFPEEQPGALIEAHLRREPPAFPGWAGPARAALAKDPAERPATGSELVRFLETGAPSADTIRVEAVPGARLDHSTPKVSTQRSRLPAVPFLISLGLALGMGFWLAGPAPAPAPPPDTVSAPPEGAPPPATRSRALPTESMRLIPGPEDAEPGLPSSSLVELGDGRVAMGLSSVRAMVVDPVSGEYQLGPVLIDRPASDRAGGLQLVPAASGGAWAVFLPEGSNTDITRVVRLDHSLGLAGPATDHPRGGSSAELSLDLGGGLWVIPAMGKEEPAGDPGTLWISRTGAAPHPVTLPALSWRRRVVAQARTPEGGVLLQVADLSILENGPGTTLVELGPDDELRWSLTIPPPGLIQARLELAPEGIYLLHEDRLWLLAREGLRGEVGRDALRPLTGPIPDLAHHSSSQAPGVLHRSPQGLELWTMLPLEGVFHGQGVFHWLRFAAEPGQVPTALTRRSEHRVRDGLTAQDHTCGVQSLLETGSPELVLLSLVPGRSAGHLVLVDLARGELAWEQVLEHPTRNATILPRARPKFFPMPGARGHWLVVPGTVDTIHGLVLEHYFEEHGPLGPRPG